MATYSENQADRERVSRKRAQDRHMAALHRNFDQAAGDVHMKYERPSFTVVTASVAFREGWDRIFGGGVSCPEPVAEKSASEARPLSTASLP